MSLTSRSASCSGCCWPGWQWAAQSSEGRSNDLDVCAGQRRVGGPAGLPRGRAAVSREVLMNADAWLVLAVYTAILVALSVPMGRYIAHVMEGRLRFAGRIEGVLYRV